MMKLPGEVYLGLSGQEIKLPEAARKVTPQVVEITRTNRTVSGALVEDIIRVYTNYQIDYEFMVGADRKLLFDLYNLGKYLSLIYVRQDGTKDEQTVKMTIADGTREYCGGEWFWSGVSVFLEVV